MKEFQKKQVMVRRSTTIENLLRSAEAAGKQQLSMRDRLVVENMKFVVTVAGQYLNMGLEEEDLVSAGYIGLVEAAEKFDPKKDVKFISFAVWYIRGAMMRELNKVPRVDDLDEATVEDTESVSADAMLEAEDIRKWIMHRLNRLEPRERDVVVMHYGLENQTLSSGEVYEDGPMPLTEIAKEMGVSRECVRLVREEALEKMRN